MTRTSTSVVKHGFEHWLIVDVNKLFIVIRNQIETIYNFVHDTIINDFLKLNLKLSVYSTIVESNTIKLNHRESRFIFK